MKLKKIIGYSALACVAAFSLAACTETGNEGPNTGGGKLTTYVMEAEYVDLDDVKGAGISSDQSGVELIYGEGTQAQKDKGWSSGYFVGFTYTAEFSMDFVFTASVESTATIIIRLGSELGDITLNPDNFPIKLNGTAINYSSMFVAGNEGDMANMTFSDKTVATSATLKAGENKITLSISPNDLRYGQTGGPTIDCIKIQTTAELTYTEKTDNPSRRGGII